MRTLHTTRTQTQCAHTARNLYNTNTLHTHTLTKDHLYLVAKPLRAAPSRSLVALARGGRAVAGRARRRAPLVARGVDDGRAGLAGGRLRRAGRLILVVLILVILLGGGRGRLRLLLGHGGGRHGHGRHGHGGRRRGGRGGAGHLGGGRLDGVLGRLLRLDRRGRLGVRLRLGVVAALAHRRGARRRARAGRGARGRAPPVTRARHDAHAVGVGGVGDAVVHGGRDGRGHRGHGHGHR